MVRPLFLRDSGKEHLAGVLEGRPAALRALFHSRVIGWRALYADRPQVDVDLFRDVIGKIKTDVAFDLVAEAVDIALTESKFDGFHFAMSLVCSLAGASKTTEVPGALYTHFSELERRAREFGGRPARIADGLKRFYRDAFAPAPAPAQAWAKTADRIENAEGRMSLAEFNTLRKNVSTLCLVIFFSFLGVGICAAGQQVMLLFASLFIFVVTLVHGGGLAKKLREFRCPQCGEDPTTWVSQDPADDAVLHDDWTNKCLHCEAWLGDV